MVEEITTADQQWQRLAQQARETNAERPVVEPEALGPAFVVAICLILGLGVLVFFWLKEGPVY